MAPASAGAIGLFVHTFQQSDQMKLRVFPAISRRVLLCGIGIGAVVASAVGAWALQDHAASEPVVAAAASSAELLRIEQELAIWTRAAGIDPYSAMFPAHAAALQLQRGRLTGDYRDAVQAETLSRKSLAQRTQHNGGAFVTLIAALLEQHRFAEANRIARQLVAGQPDVDAYNSLLGETELELGNYNAARSAFAAIRQPSSGLSTMAGVARWSELQGHDAIALVLLRRAREEARIRPGEMKEEIAWYYMREADIELRRGRVNAAAEALRAGLAMAPSDYRLLAARARLAAARGEWRDAARYGEASTFNVLDPTTLTVVATAYAELGDTAKAHEVERAAGAAVGGQAGTIHRAWAMHQLDRNQSVDSLAALARRELTIRRDVYTLDLLAWAEYKGGHLNEAHRYMSDVLRVGTTDPLFFYHAGFIQIASGDTAHGEASLEQALRLDARSKPRYARSARVLLDRVDAARDEGRPLVARTAVRARRLLFALARHEG